MSGPPRNDVTYRTLRVARATDHLAEAVQFYRDGVGLQLLGGFEDHEGFDGVMLGQPDLDWHLELTHQRGHRAGRAPNAEALLVLYLPDELAWRRACARMEAHGYPPVAAANPYWDRLGRTYEDPDGYRVVLQRGEWPPAC